MPVTVSLSLPNELVYCPKSHCKCKIVFPLNSLGRFNSKSLREACPYTQFCTFLLY